MLVGTGKFEGTKFLGNVRYLKSSNLWGQVFLELRKYLSVMNLSEFTIILLKIVTEVMIPN